MKASINALYISLSFILSTLFLFPHQSLSQHPYLIRNKTEGCSINDTSPPKEYNCTDSTDSCVSYLFLRSSNSQDSGFYFNEISLGKTNLWTNPVDCKCMGPFYQSTIQYNIKNGDSYGKNS